MAIDSSDPPEQTTAGGKDNIRGGGEFPDPDTGPDRAAGAPGPELVGHQEHGQGQFAEALARDADDQEGASP